MQVKEWLDEHGGEKDLNRYILCIAKLQKIKQNTIPQYYLGEDYLAAQKNWRKKCANLDDKILRQKVVNHQNVMNLVTK